MQVCRLDRGSVCHPPDCNSTWLSLSTTMQRQPPTPAATVLKPLTLAPSKLITERVPSALLTPAQQVRAKQSRVPFVYGRNRLLTRTSRAQKRVDLVHRLNSSRVRRHFTQIEYAFKIDCLY